MPVSADKILNAPLDEVWGFLSAAAVTPLILHLGLAEDATSEHSVSSVMMLLLEMCQVP